MPPAQVDHGDRAVGVCENEAGDGSEQHRLVSARASRSHSDEIDLHARRSERRNGRAVDQLAAHGTSPACAVIDSIVENPLRPGSIPVDAAQSLAKPLPRMDDDQLGSVAVCFSGSPVQRDRSRIRVVDPDGDPAKGLALLSTKRNHGTRASTHRHARSRAEQVRPGA